MSSWRFSYSRRAGAFGARSGPDDDTRGVAERCGFREDAEATLLELAFVVLQEDEEPHRMSPVDEGNAMAVGSSFSLTPM